MDSKTIRGFACAVACLATLGQSAATPAEGSEDSKMAIEGTWISKVTTPNPPPGLPASFLSMATYTGTGQAMEENNTPQIRSVGQGEWARTGPRSFVRTVTIFGFGPGRVFATFTKVTSVIDLAHDGETYASKNSFEIYDPNGILIVQGENAGTARRCGLGDSIPSCIAF